MDVETIMTVENLGPAYVRDGYISLLGDTDHELLRKYAALVDGDGTVLEIGSKEGASAIDITDTLPEKYDLVCSSLHEKEYYSRFRKNLITHGRWNRVMPVTGDFRSLLNHIDIKSLSFFFLDHDHTEDGMRDFMEMFLPLCVTGTWMLFHDYNHSAFPAVKKYVDMLDPVKYQPIDVTTGLKVYRAL